MYKWVFVLLCILSLIFINEGAPQYDAQSKPAAQPPAHSPPEVSYEGGAVKADAKPQAKREPQPSKPIQMPKVEEKIETSTKTPAPSTDTPKKENPSPPPKEKPTPKPMKKPVPPPASEKKPAPASQEKPPSPKKETVQTSPPMEKPQSAPSPPKPLPQKSEAKKEPEAAAAQSSQSDEPKAAPQNFKYDDCLSDTIFVIDSTSSVRDLFEQHRTYATNVVKGFDISPTTNHVGIVLYSSKQRQSIKYSLSDPQSNENVTARISLLPYLSGITATGAALQLAIKDLANRRKDVPANVVVISDGFSYDFVDEPVKELRAMSNVRVFAVSLGEAYRKFEMLMIASHEENFLTGADSYKELLRKLQQCNDGLRKGDKNDAGVTLPPSPSTMGNNNQGQTEKTVAVTTVSPKIDHNDAKKKVEKSKSSESSESSEEAEKPVKPAEVKKVVPSSTAAPSPKKESGSAEEKSVEAQTSAPSKEKGNETDGKIDVAKNKDCKYDIVFVIDASGSLRMRYQHQLEIATKLIDKFDFEKTQIGVIRYSGRRRSKVAIELGSKHSKEAFTEDFLKMPFMGGTTFTDEALDKALEEITGPHARSDSLPMVIVFTDGFSQPDPAANAKKIHAKSIPVFAIGITDGQIVNENELKSIASNPNNVFLDSNINELEELFVQLSENC